MREEVPHAPDAHDVHEHEHEEQEETPIPQETGDDTEYPVDPNVFQYESGNNEFLLDALNDYIEINWSNEDSDIVYIHAMSIEPFTNGGLAKLIDLHDGGHQICRPTIHVP